MSPAVDSVEPTVTWMHGYTKHARGCTHIFHWCTHTLRNVYVNKPRLESRHGYRCTHVRFPPGWNRPFICLFLHTHSQGSDLFSLPTEKLLPFSYIGHVYMHIKNVSILPLREKSDGRLPKHSVLPQGDEQLVVTLSFNSRRRRVKLLKGKKNPFLFFSCILAWKQVSSLLWCIVAQAAMKQMNQVTTFNAGFDNG